MPTFDYSILQNRYKGMPAYIVGKGPSLEFLALRHFNDFGPIIVLNDAIIEIQKLLHDLCFPIYSLQKDGHPDFMVEPDRKVVLVLQNTEGYSKHYFKQHRARILVDPVKDQGFAIPQVVAVRMAIAMAKYMGCHYLHLLCCDCLTSDDFRTFNPKTRSNSETGAAKFYKSSKAKVLKDLREFTHEFIVPQDHYE